MRKKIKNWFIYWSVRMLLGLFSLLSLKLAVALGSRLGRLAFRLAKRERQRTLQHLSWAFGQKSEDELYELARGVFEHFGMAVGEVACARKMRPITRYVELDQESRTVLEDSLAQGRGVVFITGHIGNWELMARALAAYGFPINTIGQRSYDPRFTKLIQKFRDEGMVRTLWRGDPDLVEQMMKVLHRGEIMGLLIDQDTKVPGVFVDFFGRQAWTPSAGAMLARKAGCPVVMGFNHRKSDGSAYAISIQRLDLSHDEEQSKAVFEDTQAMTKAIEAQIRKYPKQWVWMHRRWKTRPDSNQ